MSTVGTATSLRQDNFTSLQDGGNWTGTEIKV